VRSGSLHAFVVAGTHSGVGKTSVTIGLIEALRRRGLCVQPYKVGPDFIDPLYHAAAARRASHNLDGWMLGHAANLELFANHAARADVVVIEGMMGLFDGASASSESGSTAEMAKWIGAPALLVVDASAMARSVAAVVHGYATFDRDVRVIGVITNRVGSESHARMLGDALAGKGPLLGWLRRDKELLIPERHLGLRLPDTDSQRLVGLLGDLIEANFDLDALLQASQIPGPVANRTTMDGERGSAPRIGIARDEAFSFYYEDNLALLRAAGAELVEFSPLRDELPAALDGLYVGGGYPELYAAQLAGNRSLREAVRELAASGRPVYGECGGLIFLGDSLEIDGQRFEMAGALPLTTSFRGRLEINYCQVKIRRGPFGGGQLARGHRFHRARIVTADSATEHAYELTLPSGKVIQDGYSAGSVLASWVHVHFRSCPTLPAAFVEAARPGRRT
jgi:cobyrinic acid a,c-diamide synthase